MVDESVYWIWMQQGFGVGSRKPWIIHKMYPGGVQEFLEGGPQRWYAHARPASRQQAAEMGLTEEEAGTRLTRRELTALQSFSLSEAAARAKYALQMGWKLVTPGSRQYPAALGNIYNPPAVLYVKGELPPVDQLLTIAVAGARKATQFSLGAARAFGYQLALNGACVVSGGAAGVDAAVLSGALEIPGARIISVLPVSLDSPYMHANARLRATISGGKGALVTEYFSQQSPAFGTFPLRNRLITGLARGVLLIQAAHKSGTMLYANLAEEQNRDVFIYPGPAGDPSFAGGHQLLAEGAKAVVSGEEVLREYRGKGQEAPARQRPVPKPVVHRAEPAVLSDPMKGLSPQAGAVWQALARTPMTIAQLEEKTGIDAASLLGILTELELDGLAESLPGKRYLRGAGSA